MRLWQAARPLTAVPPDGATGALVGALDGDVDPGADRAPDGAVAPDLAVGAVDWLDVGDEALTAAQALTSALMSADAVASCESMACCWLSTTAWAWATLACAAAIPAFDPAATPVADPPLAVPCVPAEPVPVPEPAFEPVCVPDDPALLDEVGAGVVRSRTAGVTVNALVAALCVTCVVEPAPLDDVDDDVDGADDELVVPASCAAVSAASVCCALATSASAAWVCWFSAVMSSCARVCPAATCWPSCAATDATLPDSAKLTVARSTDETVPTEVTVWVTDPRVTLASR